MSRILNAYISSLYRRPFLTHSCTAATLWLTGDALAQRIEKGKWREIDPKRLAVFTAFGGFGAGPLYALWYKALDKFMAPYLIRAINKLTTSSNVKPVALPHPGIKTKVAVGKTIADMILFEPPFISFFFTFTNLLTGSSWEENKKQLKEDLPKTYLIDVAVWTPIQLLNFRYVPVSFQPVLVNSVNIAWNCFLSSVQSKSPGSPSELKLGSAQE